MQQTVVHKTRQKELWQRIAGAMRFNGVAEVWSAGPDHYVVRRINKLDVQQRSWTLGA